MRGYQPQVELLTEGYGGVNTSLQFSQLPREQSPRMKNAWAPKIGAIGKRPGTVPVTTAALANAIPYLTKYKISPSVGATEEIYAASGTKLYKYNGAGTFTALTMTAALNQTDIRTVGATDSLLASYLYIADQAALKKCDGSAVTLVTPAVDDVAPAPANMLADVNTAGIKFIWTYKAQMFFSKGDNFFYYSKPFIFNYVPETQYGAYLKDNDFINGGGVEFDNVCLIPMRRGWGILSGNNIDNFVYNEFLNTAYGVIAPKSIAKLTYPDGTQTVAYASDNSIHEIFTAINDGGGRQYATRDLMKDKIDFNALGLTEAEKAAIVGTFDARRSLYLLSFKKAGVNYTYAYDVKSREWYPDWLTFNAQAYVSLNSEMYFAGSTGHLHKFDDDLYSDWTDSAQTTGTPVYFQRYSSLLSLEKSAYSSYWDYFIIEQKQYPIPSTLDVTVIFTDSTVEAANAIDTNFAVWDTTSWDDAYWANEDFTETVNSPRRIVYKKKSRYTQVLLENSRDEPVELYFEKWLGRTSGQ